ncbi:MNIO family bufferin maturase [Mangrovitalea sediminis]|uniref:MNIO family bufferin maturase n=1 Tax=Mangrovitalea sediminis TaxID=1982043 RepID=UPI000BE4F908|nr:DUF692 domain-containing protein [Mangrovitalea sediminis]
MNITDWVGVGLRVPHHGYFMAQRPSIGWLEVHSENYFHDANLRGELLALAEVYPISLHGTGLSLGSVDPLSQRHLAALRRLIDEVSPVRLSEHLSWSSVGGTYFNDLLPIPYTEEALEHMVARIDTVQQALGRQLLIENPSSYLQYRQSSMTEWDFLAALPERCGCGLLLDLNNIFVSSLNHGFAVEDYLSAVPFEHVGEIHLAGFEVQHFDDGDLCIDTHSRPVSDPVWQWFRAVTERHGKRLTLIEWDRDLPEPEVLLGEAGKARDIMTSLAAAEVTA